MASKEQVQYVSNVCAMFEARDFHPHLEDASGPERELIVFHIGPVPENKQPELIRTCQEIEAMTAETPKQRRVATQVRYFGGR